MTLSGLPTTVTLSATSAFGGPAPTFFPGLDARVAGEDPGAGEGDGLETGLSATAADGGLGCAFGPFRAALSAWKSRQAFTRSFTNWKKTPPGVRRRVSCVSSDTKVSPPFASV